MNTTFEARSLWATQVPYVESDTMPIIVGYITRMVFVAELARISHTNFA